MSNNKNNKTSKSTIAARIVCGVLAALFVISGAYAIIAYLI